MTWFKFDDNAVDHPKVSSLTDKAFRWWVRGLSYASRYLTDGLLPKVFWKKVPKGARSELVSSKLWDWIAPDFMIHDYAKHQSLKEDVEADKERNRHNSKAYRDRRRAERRQAASANVSADASANRQRPVSDESAPQRTDNREQITENREQRTPSVSHGGGRLIVTGTQFQKLMETHAYVGTNLRVPKVLHSELISKSGANADVELRAWYAQLDEQLERDGKGTGDVFAWLRPRHQAFAVSRGWIDAAPKPLTPARQPFSIQAVLDKKAGKVS